MQALSQLSYSPVFGKARILCRTHAFVNGGTVFFYSALILRDIFCSEL